MKSSYDLCRSSGRWLRQSAWLYWWICCRGHIARQVCCLFVWSFDTLMYSETPVLLVKTFNYLFNCSSSMLGLDSDDLAADSSFVSMTFIYHLFSFDYREGTKPHVKNEGNYLKDYHNNTQRRSMEHEQIHYYLIEL